MYLDEILAAQKRGEAKGITSVCSAHPFVLKEALKVFTYPLIESTCNQVNQFGGYTGMTPANFIRYVRMITTENNFPFGNIILGGDHFVHGGAFLLRYTASENPILVHGQNRLR